MAKHCWEIPGCDDEMSGRCPHQTLCPLECAFAKCTRSTHEQVNVFEALDYPETDRYAARKEVCRFCRFFLVNGPKTTQVESMGEYHE